MSDNNRYDYTFLDPQINEVWEIMEGTNKGQQFKILKTKTKEYGLGLACECEFLDEPKSPWGSGVWWPLEKSPEVKFIGIFQADGSVKNSKRWTDLGKLPECEKEDPHAGQVYNPITDTWSWF